MWCRCRRISRGRLIRAICGRCVRRVIRGVWVLAGLIVTNVGGSGEPLAVVGAFLLEEGAFEVGEFVFAFAVCGELVVGEGAAFAVDVVAVSFCPSVVFARQILLLVVHSGAFRM